MEAGVGIAIKKAAPAVICAVVVCFCVGSAFIVLVVRLLCWYCFCVGICLCVGSAFVVLVVLMCWM